MTLEEIATTLDALRADAAETEYEPDDLPALVSLVETLRSIGSLVSEATWVISAQIGDLIGDRYRNGKATLDDGRTVEYATGDRRVWDRDRAGAALEALRKVAAVDRRVDQDTGEIESADEALCRLLREAARLEWRATALRERGLDPDAYSDWKRGRPSIRVVGGSK